MLGLILNEIIINEIRNLNPVRSTSLFEVVIFLNRSYDGCELYDL